jgi:hypothetical protein
MARGFAYLVALAFVASITLASSALPASAGGGPA